MSKMKAKLIQRSAMPSKAPVKATKAKAAGLSGFVFVNDGSTGDATFEVLGTDDAGDMFDISEVASLAPPPVSADTAFITADAPTGMKCTLHKVGPLTTSPVNITFTATWNDGSKGPFAYDLPCEVKPGPVTGIAVIVAGQPIAHP